MGVIGQGVEKQVGQPVPRQMLVRRQSRREDQARRIDAARRAARRKLPAAGIASSSHSTLPGTCCQQPHPDIE